MEKMVTRVPTDVAASILEKSEDFIRWGLRQNKFPFGVAVKTGAKRWSYHISVKKFSDYTGIPADEIRTMILARKEVG